MFYIYRVDAVSLKQAPCFHSDLHTSWKQEQRFGLNEMIVFWILSVKYMTHFLEYCWVFIICFFFTQFMPYQSLVKYADIFLFICTSVTNLLPFYPSKVTCSVHTWFTGSMGQVFSDDIIIDHWWACSWRFDLKPTPSVGALYVKDTFCNQSSR